MVSWKSIKLLAVSLIALLLLAGCTTSEAAGTPSNSSPNLEQASQSQPLVLTDGQGRYSLGAHIDILEDPTGELTIEDVTSPEYAARFNPPQAAVPNYGYTDSAYWIHFTLDNQTSVTYEWLLMQGFANTHYIDLYTPSANGQGYIEKKSGSLLPVSMRDVINPNVVFNLTVPLQSQQTEYVRIKSQASMTIDLSLWTNSAFINTSNQSLILHWLIFGGFLALMVYHGFFLVSLREPIYLYFFIMLASMLAVLLTYTGYLGIYIFPGMNRYDTVLFPLFIAVLYISIILFSDTFLELKTRFPIFHKTNIAFLIWWGILLLLVPFISYLNLSRLMTPTQLVTIGITWLIGVTVMRSSTRQICFFLLAWIGMAASLVLLLLVRLPIIPSTYFNENIFQLGFIVMAVSWSLALADRINLLKFTTEKANRSLRSSELK
ncbi:MAG: hypothetical protein FIA98_01175, partial [Anaerolineae bacterium]|nr:hypothetical protein [Anaerolineae bacterium]